MKSIYLAGPITGLSYDGARNGWRAAFAKLVPPTIECFSPMRAKDFLAQLATMPHTTAALTSTANALSSARGIITRDFNDVSQRDLIVANFLGAERVSIGTVWELGAAYALRKPVIIVMEPTGNVHEHAFITDSTGYRVTNIEEAAVIATAVLSGGV